MINLKEVLPEDIPHIRLLCEWADEMGDSQASRIADILAQRSTEVGYAREILKPSDEMAEFIAVAMRGGRIMWDTTEEEIRLDYLAEAHNAILALSSLFTKVKK